MLVSFGPASSSSTGMLAVGAQAIGEHAPGGAGTDDDVIEFEASLLFFIVSLHAQAPKS